MHIYVYFIIIIMVQNKVCYVRDVLVFETCFLLRSIGFVWNSLYQGATKIWLIRHKGTIVSRLELDDLAICAVMALYQL